MSIRAQEVQLIEERLKKEGISYDPLSEDIIDHICIEVEERMDEGQKFMDALDVTLLEFAPSGLSDIEDATTKDLKNFTMLKSYVTVAWRNMMQHKPMLLINLTGLALGFACVLLIYRYVEYEMSYDTMHPSKDQVYRLITHRQGDNGDTYHSAFTGAPWGPALEADHPEIEVTTRMMKYRLPVQVSLESGTNRFLEPDLIWADNSIFTLFHLPILTGDAQNPLASPNSIVISEQLAKKYFGDENPIGKRLEYEGSFGLQVTAVMQDMPDNVHFKADLIGSFNTLGHSFWHIMDNWSILYYYTYLKLKQESQPGQVENNFPQFYAKYLGENADRYQGELQSIRDIYLHSDLSGEMKANADYQQLMMLVVIAGLIMLLAITNFISLTTSRLIPRFKEVGVRKVMGGLRSDFFFQFITEAFVVLAISLALALLLGYFIFPYFISFVEKPLVLFNDLWLLELIGFILVMLVLSVVTGLYPASIMAGLSPSGALKGVIHGSGSSQWLREGQVLFQYVICICLIVATFQVGDQMKFIQDKDLGFDEEDILMVPLYISGDLSGQQAELVSNELTRIPGVQHASVTSHKLVGDQPYGASYAFHLSGRPTDTLSMNRIHVDRHFVETYNIELVAGRNYSKDFSTDTSAFLINEQALKALGLSDPQAVLGGQISYLTQNENGRYLRRGSVIGVIKDFNFSSLHSTIQPMVIDIQAARSHFVACKLGSGLSESTLASIENAWGRLLPESPFAYTVLGDHLSESYKEETRLSELLQYFSFISILIAGLGMLGLASGTAAKRVKEIGVRKVLGASNTTVIMLLFKSFIILIGIALLVSSPLAYYLLDTWLSGFAYHAPINWTNFGLAAIISFGLTVLSVGYITISAAMANPVRTLRSE
ncbi:MAG: ABC transporter permease [Bacteroidota bacterium]